MVVEVAVLVIVPDRVAVRENLNGSGSSGGGWCKVVHLYRFCLLFMSLCVDKLDEAVPETVSRVAKAAVRSIEWRQA